MTWHLNEKETPFKWFEQRSTLIMGLLCNIDARYP